MKQNKIKPLYSFEELKNKIKISENIPLPDVFDPDGKLMEKVHEFADKHPGVILVQEGDKSDPDAKPAAVSTTIREPGRGRYYSFPEPNPVHIYLKTSYDRYLESNHYHGRLLKTNPADFDSQFKLFIEYFGNKSTAIIMNALAVEAYINQILPDDFKLDFKGELLDKAGIERLSIKDKLKVVIPALTGIDLQHDHPALYSGLLELFNMRDRLVHLKRFEMANKTHYTELYNDMLKFDYEKYRHFSVEYMNMIMKDFVQPA